MAKELTVKTNVGEQVISRINSLCEVGFTMPRDYSYVNAIKMSMLKLQDVKDKNGKPALEVCTTNSIQTALFKMVTKGLNASLSQGYFLVRGNQLCFDESYFGKILMVKRLYPDWNPVPVVIREGDVFEYTIDVESGKKKVTKHEQKLENIDNDFKGGYMYLPTGELYVMTRKQILTAWSKSASREQTVQKTFDEKMVQKTIISTGLNKIINATPEYQFDDSTFDENAPKHEDVTELEEVDEQTINDVQELNEEAEQTQIQGHEEKHEVREPSNGSDGFENNDEDF